jgi:hypothetical protein
VSKRIGRGERVARLHNLSADVVIANVAASVPGAVARDASVDVASVTATSPQGQWVARPETADFRDAACHADGRR